MDRQESISKTSGGFRCDGGISRRSIDWRDSGIVIEEDQQFNSVDAIFDSDTKKPSLPANDSPLTEAGFRNVDGDTMLHLAAVGSTLNEVKDLIQMFDVNAINSMLQTPLHVATLANRPEIVELLLSSGARLNVHDRRGNTPLHLACQNGLKQITCIMLDAVTNCVTSDLLCLDQHIELTNFDGETCLHLAASRNEIEIIEMLVKKYNADLAIQDSRSGATILHKAIIDFNVERVESILKLKTHCNRGDYAGHKPSDTIKILRNSKLTQSQLTKLVLIEKLVSDAINQCIEHNGCCSLNDELLVCSSSRSECSDSDSS